MKIFDVSNRLPGAVSPDQAKIRLKENIEGLSTALNSKTAEQELTLKKPSVLQRQPQIRNEFVKAEKKLVVLDYDGTLVPFSDQPETAIPSNRLRNILRLLIDSTKTDVVLISGRPREFLEEWFSDFSCLNIIAEHGVWGRKTNQSWELLGQFDDAWKKEVNPLLSQYVRKLPGSFLEEKDYTVVFHYRKADPDDVAFFLPKLKAALDSLIDHSMLEIMEGNKILEIHCSNAGKGNAILNFVKDNYWPVILAFGDDKTDEDMFSGLPDHSVSVKVGPSDNSIAKYEIETSEDVLDFLEQLMLKEPDEIAK